MEQKQMKLPQTLFTLAIAGVLPWYFEYIHKSKIVEGNSTLFVILWFILNFMFIITITQMVKNYLYLKKLEELKYNTTPMGIGIIAIVLFAIAINVYFITQVYVKSPEVFRIILPIVFLLLLGLYVVTLFYGRLPAIESRDNLVVYNINKDKAPIRDGFEKFGSHTGTYNEGLVIGNDIFPYTSIKSAFVDKNNVLVIKGKKSEKNYVVNYGAEMGKNRLVEILKEKSILK